MLLLTIFYATNYSYENNLGWNLPLITHVINITTFLKVTSPGNLLSVLIKI